MSLSYEHPPGPAQWLQRRLQHRRVSRLVSPFSNPVSACQTFQHLTDSPLGAWACSPRAMLSCAALLKA